MGCGTCGEMNDSTWDRIVWKRVKSVMDLLWGWWCKDILITIFRLLKKKMDIFWTLKFITQRNLTKNQQLKAIFIHLSIGKWIFNDKVEFLLL